MHLAGGNSLARVHIDVADGALAGVGPHPETEADQNEEDGCLAHPGATGHGVDAVTYEPGQRTDGASGGQGDNPGDNHTAGG